MKAALFLMVLIALSTVAWIGNLVALIDCDFVAPYKCEAIHAIGLAPPIALITVWYPTDL